MKDSEKINLLGAICVSLVIVLIITVYNYKQDNNDCQKSSTNASDRIAQITKSSQVSTQECQDSLHVCDGNVQSLKDDIKASQNSLNLCQANVQSLKDDIKAQQNFLNLCQANLQTPKDYIQAQQNSLRVCEVNLQSLKDDLQTQQNSRHVCEANLQSLKDDTQNQQNQIREIIWSLLEPHSSKVNITKEQFDCSLNNLYKKYTPFNILFTLFRNIAIDFPNMMRNPTGPAPPQIVKLASDICNSGSTCNLPSVVNGFCQNAFVQK